MGCDYFLFGMDIGGDGWLVMDVIYMDACVICDLGRWFIVADSGVLKYVVSFV